LNLGILFFKRNILLKNGNLKIADFGLAKILEAKSTNSCIGTPAYMSPEIWKKEGYDFKSDVWCELTKF
jgi:serine/threonine protein kinase